MSELNAEKQTTIIMPMIDVPIKVNTYKVLDEIFTSEDDAKAFVKEKQLSGKQAEIEKTEHKGSFEFPHIDAIFGRKAGTEKKVPISALPKNVAFIGLFVDFVKNEYDPKNDLNLTFDEWLYSLVGVKLESVKRAKETQKLKNAAKLTAKSFEEKLKNAPENVQTDVIRNAVIARFRAANENATEQQIAEYLKLAGL